MNCHGPEQIIEHEKTSWKVLEFAGFVSLWFLSDSYYVFAQLSIPTAAMVKVMLRDAL